MKLPPSASRKFELWYGTDQVVEQTRRWTDLGEEFSRRFPSSVPEIWLRAPGRTELGGNHTDHNGGRVLAGALDLDLACAARRRDDHKVILVSRGWDRPFEVDLSDLTPRTGERGTTEALIRGMAAELGARIGGWEALVDPRVLPGSGVSSSAALEVLLGGLFNGLYNDSTLKPLDLARAGQRAENHFFGKPCGLMDQTASALGGILSIDFGASPPPSIRSLHYDFKAHGYFLALVDTGASHADLTEDYASVPREMMTVAQALGRATLGEVAKEDFLAALPRLKVLGGRALLRALHFFDEDHRAGRMASLLEEDKLEDYLREVRASGSSSWRFLQNVIPEAAKHQPLALALGLTEDFLGSRGACRVHGGGFAGTLQAYVPEDHWPEFQAFCHRVFGPDACREVRLCPSGLDTLQSP